jgi:hypothetical protein
MSHSGGKITGNVTISDIKAVLATSENSEYALCRHSSINIWAKYKPVKLNNSHTMDQWDSANGKWKDDADWFHGPSGCSFGLRPYSSSVFDDIISNTTGGMNGWVYERPVGNSTYRCRLVDFKEYNHLAPPALSNFICTQKTAQGKNFSASCAMGVGGSDGVSLEDLQVPRYFGVALLNSNNGVVCHGTASVAGGADVSWTMPGLNLGTYTVMPFLCSDAIPMTIGSFASQHTFYTCPNIAPSSVEVTSPTGVHDISFSGEWWDSAMSRFTMNITNNESTEYAATLYIRRTGRHWYDAAQRPDEADVPLTLTANATTTVRRSVDSSTYQHDLYVRLTADGALWRVELAIPLPPGPEE